MAGKTYREMAARIEQATKRLSDTFWRRVAENGGLPAKPEPAKELRKKRSLVLYQYGLRLVLNDPAPGGSIKEALDALEAIDRGER